MIVLILSLLLLTPASNGMGEGPYVIDLDRNSFNQTLAHLSPSTPSLIEFYASWCGHCVHFAPEWRKVTQAFHSFDLPLAAGQGANHNEKELFVARVDCAKEVDVLCKQFEVPSFPHLTMATAGAYLARNLSAIKIHKLIVGGANAKTLIKWAAEELKRGEWGIALDNAAVENLIQRSTEEDLTSPTPSSSPPLPPPLLPNGTLWTSKDVESATIYLYQSITSQSSLFGSEKRMAMLKLIRLWSLAHPSVGCRQGSLSLIKSFDSQAWPDKDQKPKATYLLDHAICGSKALEKYLKTKPEERYMACRGSKEGTRGFTCGLWVSFHTFAVGLPELNNGDSGLVLMEGLQAFASHFFLCQECALHFTALLESEAAKRVKTRRDAILWLWRAHNEVNVRLMEEEKIRASASSDPLHPKIIFPSLQDCPKCRRQDRGTSETPTKDNDWDLDQIFYFLLRSYGSNPGSTDEVSKRAQSETLGDSNAVKSLVSGDEELSSPGQWVNEEVKGSFFSREQISSSWVYLEINLLLVVLGLVIVGSLILSSVCMRRARGKDSRIKFHYASDNV